MGSQGVAPILENVCGSSILHRRTNLQLGRCMGVLGTDYPGSVVFGFLFLATQSKYESSVSFLLMNDGPTRPPESRVT